MKAFVIRSTDIGRCPKHSFSARHYREDGSCRCEEEAAHARRVKWAKANRTADDPHYAAAARTILAEDEP